MISTAYLRNEVTGLIHQYSEEFEPEVALTKMKSGKQWPRAEYMNPFISLPSIANMLRGLDFRYQADLVHLLRETVPNMSEICRLFAASRQDLNGWDDIVGELTMSDDEIMLYWNNKRKTAANSGTWMHAMLEHMLNGYKIKAGPMQGEMDAVIGFLSENLQDKYNSYGKKMAPPVHDVDDCQGQHYRLQLNIYKCILEKYYDIIVQQMKVVCVHPRYLPHGFIDDVPDMQDTVAKMMQCCRDKKAAVSMQKAEGDVGGLKHGIVPEDATTSRPDRTAKAPEQAEDDMEIALEKLMMEEEDANTHVLAKKGD
eukprot:s4459_g5.t1